METTMSELATAVYDVEKAVERVEAAVKAKSTSFQLLFCGIIGYYVLFILPPSIWHAQWRYAFEYGVASNDVHAETKPHDCNFLAAPLGAKYCHYERLVSTVKETKVAGRWDLNCDNVPVVDQQACLKFRRWMPGADPERIVAVVVNWEKKED